MLATAACGGDSSSDSGDSGSGGSGGDSAKQGGRDPARLDDFAAVGGQRPPSLQQAFDDAGIESDIQNAEGDVAKFGTICDGMINSGVQVLMIVNLDSESVRALPEEGGRRRHPEHRLRPAHPQRRILYVSFDNVVVGELMGEGLQTCLDDAGETKANIIYINGDPTDNNAALFKSGSAGAAAQDQAPGSTRWSATRPACGTTRSG